MILHIFIQICTILFIFYEFWHCLAQFHKWQNDEILYSYPKQKWFEAYLLVLQNIKPYNSMQPRCYYFGMILTLEFLLKPQN